jgi:hypothetical protein
MFQSLKQSMESSEKVDSGVQIRLAHRKSVKKGPYGQVPGQPPHSGEYHNDCSLRFDRVDRIRPGRRQAAGRSPERDEQGRRRCMRADLAGHGRRGVRPVGLRMGQHAPGRPRPCLVELLGAGYTIPIRGRDDGTGGTVAAGHCA